MPVVLPGVEGIAILALVASFVVLIGLQKGWSVTFGWIFRTLGDSLMVVGIAGVHPFHKVGTWLRSLDRNVYHALGVAALGCEHAASWLWTQTANQVAWIGREIADLAHDTAQALGAVNTTIVKPAVKIIDRNSVVRIGKVSAALGLVITARLPALVRSVAALSVKVAHLTKTVAVDVGRLEAKAGRAAADIRSHGLRLSKLEKALSGIGAAALVGTALARLGLQWLRCPNVGRAGRAVCGMDGNLLESLLIDAAVLAVAFNIEEFARELQGVTEEAANAIHDWAT